MKTSFSNTGARHSVAPICLVVGLAMLTLVMQASGATAVTLDEAVDGQQILCRVLGSHPEPPLTRTSADGINVVQMTCHGGSLDGATCVIVPETDADGAVTSTCYPTTVAGDIHVAPGAGVVDASDPGTGGADDTGNVAIDPEEVEDPTRGEPEATTGFPVDEIVQALVDGCHNLGGADAEITRPEADAPPESIAVRCVGGPLYDLHCTVADESLTCQWLEPRVKPTTEVVTDVRVVGAAPTPAFAEQVDTPAPPTPAMDDDSGTDPTMPPTFTAPDNVGGNRAPLNGDVEDSTPNEPTPTAGPIGQRQLPLLDHIGRSRR